MRDDKEEKKKKDLHFDAAGNILFAGGSVVMGKLKRRPTNVRTVGDEVKGKHLVSDKWPPTSYSGKHFLRSHVFTRVVEGAVYVERHLPGKMPTTTIHRAGDAFTQNPDVVYAVGSVYGAKTTSFSQEAISPIFIPQPDDDE